MGYNGVVFQDYEPPITANFNINELMPSNILGDAPEYASYIIGGFGNLWWLTGDEVYQAGCERATSDSLNIHQEASDGVYGSAGGFAPYQGYAWHAKKGYYASNSHYIYINFYDYLGVKRKRAIINGVLDGSEYGQTSGAEISSSYFIVRIVNSINTFRYFSLPIIGPTATSPNVFYQTAASYVISGSYYDYNVPTSLPHYHFEDYGQNYFSDGVNLYSVDGYSTAGDSHINLVGPDPYPDVVTNPDSRYSAIDYAMSTRYPESWFFRWNNEENTENGFEDGETLHGQMVNYDESIELTGEINENTFWEFTPPYQDDNTLYVYLNFVQKPGLICYDENANPVFADAAGCVWKILDDVLTCLNPIEGYKVKNCEYITDQQAQTDNYIPYGVRHVWYIDDRDVATPSGEHSIYMVSPVWYAEEDKYYYFKYKLVSAIGSAEVGPNKQSALKTDNKYSS